MWGYGHLVVFASATAVGAGLAVAVDYTTHHAEIAAVGAGAAVAIPAALYLLSLWALHERPRAANLLEASLAPMTVLLILLTPFSGQPVLLTGLLLSALLAIKLVGRQRSTKGHEDELSPTRFQIGIASPSGKLDLTLWKPPASFPEGWC